MDKKDKQLSKTTQGIALAKVGKSTQGTAIRKNGKTIFINRDGSIDNIWTT